MDAKNIPLAVYTESPQQNGKAGQQRPKKESNVSTIVVIAIIAAAAIVALLLFTDVGDQFFGSSSNSSGTEGDNNEVSLSPTAFGETRAPTPSPTPNPSSAPTPFPTSSPNTNQALFPAETRNGDNYVGLFLLNEMSDEAFAAFQSAADKWSAIVDGTTPQSGTIGAGQTFCEVTFPQDKFFDHLIIGAQVQAIDGVGGTLGSAGPCAFIDLPLFGVMTFDSADIQSLVNQGAVESVILHEMGHVLGIGTLWSSFGLLDDPVFADNGAVNVNNQPKMTGSNAVAQYRLLTGNNNEQFVPVEDGTTNGQDIFNPKSNGRGSIDGHWDEDFFLGELMAFSINTNGAPPPMSATTIASLADFGYNVDLSLAEAYSVSRARAQRLRGERNEIKMINDIHSFVPVQLGPSN